MTYARALASLGVTVTLAIAGCGGDSGGGGDGAVGPGAPDGGRPGTDVRLGGGTPTNGTATIRFVNVFAPGGDKSAVDLSVQDRNGWQVLASSLAYGTATQHVAVPVRSFGDTLVVITPPGGDPSMVQPSADRTLLLGLKDGLHATFFFYDSRNGMPAPAPATHLAWTEFDDGGRDYTPPAGKAILQGIKQTIQSTDFFWSWALQGMGCLGGGDGLNNEQAKVDPGSYVVSGADDSMPGCAGPTVIMPVTIQAEAGKAYFIFPVGEDKAELKMVALPAVP